MYPDDFLRRKLDERIAKQSLSKLQQNTGAIDFCSNDYLGIATRQLLTETEKQFATGSGGSRLLAGNYPLLSLTEEKIADFHEAASALIFNSGYDANVGLLSCVPQKGDTILYDYLIRSGL